MRCLLQIVTEYIDNFAEENKNNSIAANNCRKSLNIHGIPRTTMDLDILFYYNQETNSFDNLCKRLALYLKEKFGNVFEKIRYYCLKRTTRTNYSNIASIQFIPVDLTIVEID